MYQHFFKHFNPRAPYGARPQKLQEKYTKLNNFNPRAPYGARLIKSVKYKCIPSNFNPRAPYGARLNKVRRLIHTQDFNPRAPYGARRESKLISLGISMISILGPLAGRDLSPSPSGSSVKLFQSSRPLRGVTPGPAGRLRPGGPISILAPLTGRDSKNTQKSRVFLQ